MHTPVLITAPTVEPVTLADAKLHMRVDGDDENGLISAFLSAATAHLDGWTGILGRCLSEQEWREDFDCFGAIMRLRLWPVTEITSITWRNAVGQMATVSSDDYALMSDSTGAYIRFKDNYIAPGDLYQVGAVSVTYVAGYPAIEPEGGGDPVSTVPAPIKTAIMLLAAHWYQNREAVSADAGAVLPLSVSALLAPYKRRRL